MTRHGHNLTVAKRSRKPELFRQRPVGMASGSPCLCSRFSPHEVNASIFSPSSAAWLSLLLPTATVPVCSQTSNHQIGAAPTLTQAAGPQLTPRQRKIL
jgi:hypothetical protein